MLVISNMSLGKRMEASKTSTSQIPLQVFNTNTINKTITMTNDFIVPENSRKTIDHKKIIQNTFFTLCVIVFLLNLHFILYFNLEANTNDKTSKQQSLLGLVSNTSPNFTFNSSLVFTKCLPKGLSYTNFMKEWWNIIDLFFTFFIPFLTLTVTFVFILLKLKRLNRIYLNLSKENSNKLIYLKKIQRNKLVLLKLFFVNFYFFISIFPYFLFKTFLEINYPFLNTFFTILFYSNNALNIIFYGFSCQTFRQTISKKLATVLCNFIK